MCVCAYRSKTIKKQKRSFVIRRLAKQKNRTEIDMYVYIYIYMCVCVCVCASIICKGKINIHMCVKVINHPSVEITFVKDDEVLVKYLD